MMNLAEYRNRNTRLADFLPWVALVGEGVESPVSPVNPALFARLQKAMDATYPGVTLKPSMSSGGTDGREFRSAGIPTYGAGALALGTGGFLDPFE